MQLTPLKPWINLSDIKAPRWTKANNGRLLPLNSAAWQKLRGSVLAGEPLCRLCTAQGLTVAATCVDHIHNNPADNRLEALQSLCHECHSRKTARDMGHNVRMGCAMDGTPLDHLHHWNKPADASLVRPRSPDADDLRPSVLPCFNAKCGIVV